MKRGRLILLGLLATALGLVLWLVLRPHEPEPTYQGKPLSYWLIRYNEYQSSNPALATQATNAVHKIGTNALPFLVSWMDYEAPEDKHAEMLGLMPVRFPRSWFRRLLAGPREVRASIALSGFEILGDKAAPAVPALTRLLSDGNSINRVAAALGALKYVGKDGLPPLVAVLTNKTVPPSYRNVAAERIAMPVVNLGTNVAWAVPLLIPCLGDSNAASTVAYILGDWKLEPKTVVPALAACLRSPSTLAQVRAAEALEKFGSEASSAVPDLVAATSSEDEVVRVSAREALRKIAPQEPSKAAH